MSAFTKKDYNSSDGMMTSIWGPSIWHYLHVISFNYPIKPSSFDKKQYTNMLMYTGATLPCSYCRNNFKLNLKRSSFSQKSMENRDKFSRFVYKLHNCVNQMLKKKIKISFDEVRDRYENFRSRCIQSDKNIKDKTQDKEDGCLVPLYGKKSKCSISIIPFNSKKKSFYVDPKCKLKKCKKK
jgi:hypothetical protein